MRTLPKLFSATAVICFALLIWSCKPSDEIKTLQATYIPSSISGVYISMSLKEFKKARSMENLSLTRKGDIAIYKEEFTKDSISLFQYHFKKNKLSKLLVEYKDDYELYETFKTRFGEPNSGKAWLVVIDKKLSLLMWTQQNTLIIADNKLFKN